LGQNFLTIIGENAGHRVLQTFTAWRPDIIGAAPEIHLFVAPFPYGIVFIHAAKHAIIALIESSVANDLHAGHASFRENQLQRVLRADEIGGEGAVEENTARLEA